MQMLIYITNRKLCRDHFLDRIEQLASGKPYAIMLREKDLNEADYETLAIQVKERCDAHQVPLLINQQIGTAAKLAIPAVHLSMENLRKYTSLLPSFQQVGASVHSLEEALEAQALGVHYLIAGHIFATNSKKGVPPRGLSFLEEICCHSKVPVFAIGGITKDKVTDILLTGASGMCIMSEAMTCENPKNLASQFRVK